MSQQCPCSQGGPWDPGVHREECGQQVKGGGLFPLRGPGEAHPEYSVQFWSPQSKKDKERVQCSHKDDGGSGASLLRGETGGVRPV